ncbi:helix-turn-helix domain-containing protein [Streptomyces cavernicola]|uniref:Helix-turn-helix domain-containing protein n=1 Tax=Streptomyces cavernicola TaxID=3043613 RepID=A0ABT6S2D6_9ACTN|nr:helix-turn-helix domain-containing protein [Streptomyces sp. B-S-A6]MDI3402252.1 helix-turn-helix domain-containing protein [Streptomyces sp. B-S-A6]
MYEERPSRYEGAVLWSKRPVPPPGSRQEPPRGPWTAPYPVLPDGCMDLLWTEGRLFVAGPDTRAYAPAGEGGPTIVGLRFAPGTAPALLGVPAHELRDRRVDLADLWPAARVRNLTARVDAAPDPASALEALALEHGADRPHPDPVLLRVVASLAEGRTVGATADALGLGARRLHRHALAAFGYGPKTLARVLRLQRALALARSGLPDAETAAVAGYADQAHLARDVRELTGLRLTELLSRRP